MFAEQILDVDKRNSPGVCTTSLSQLCHTPTAPSLYFDRIRKLHGNADYAAFFNKAGIPSLDLSYRHIYVCRSFTEALPKLFITNC